MDSSKPVLSPSWLARELAKSQAVSFGTTAPFQLGDVRIEKVGFADIPILGVIAMCRPQDISALVPIVRQYVYRELETSGMTSDILEFTPRVAVEKKRYFIDCNGSSPTKGQRKLGSACRFSFEIRKEHVGAFDWDGRYGSIPVALGTQNG
jgi:hypothetical protein